MALHYSAASPGKKIENKCLISHSSAINNQMPDVSDIELLRDFNRQGSEDAFAELVRRHINLVYSTACRHVGIAAHAEEITQAVFVILARKAAGLRPDTILEAWLYETTRLTALNFLRGERRRQMREQEAYMQSTIQESADVSVWNQLAPLLDEAMARLEKKDREAVVLRFFKQKSLGEVAAAMQITEAAAQSRVHRAVEKLQKYFASRGIDSAADTIARTISTHSVQVAPALLAKSVTAAALAKGAAVSTSTLALVKATLIAMKTKTIVATVAAAVIVAGITTWLAGSHFFHKSQPVSTGIPGETIPVLFANDAFAAKANAQFVIDIDPDTRRTTDSTPAGHIKSLVKMDVNGSSAWYLSPLLGGTNLPFPAVSRVGYPVASNSLLLGKRVRMSGWIKAKDVENWAGGTLSIGYQKHNYGFDYSTDRPIVGTADWQQVEFVTDLPNEPCYVYFSVELYGSGEIWLDDFRLDIASPATPLTNDKNMRFFSARPADYSHETDYQVKHDGHPAYCIAYLPEGKPPPGARMYWGKEFYYPDTEKYLGHTVRMTFWAKSENLTGAVTPSLHPRASTPPSLRMNRATHPSRAPLIGRNTPSPAAYPSKPISSTTVSIFPAVASSGLTWIPSNTKSSNRGVDWFLGIRSARRRHLCRCEAQKKAVGFVCHRTLLGICTCWMTRNCSPPLQRSGRRRRLRHWWSATCRWSIHPRCGRCATRIWPRKSPKPCSLSWRASPGNSAGKPF